MLAPEKEDLFGEVLFGVKMFRKCVRACTCDFVCVWGEGRLDVENSWYFEGPHSLLMRPSTDGFCSFKCFVEFTSEAIWSKAVV